MAEVVYILCALTSLVCSLLLAKAYVRAKTRLLFFSSLCFGALALSNGLLFVDLVLVPQIDLQLMRTIAALIGIGTMVVGLIWGGVSE